MQKIKAFFQKISPSLCLCCGCSKQISQPSNPKIQHISSENNLFLNQSSILENSILNTTDNFSKIKKITNSLIKIYRSLNLCDICIDLLPWLKNTCMQCGISLTILHSSVPSSFPIHCGECLKNPPPFDETVSVFHYQKPIDQFIMRLKFNDDLAYAKLLGQLLAQKILTEWLNANITDIQNSLPQCIIPMPLHRKRLRQRGFNQAYEIAKYVSYFTEIKINDTCCERRKFTPPQSGLSAEQRKKNLKEAFFVKPNFSAQHVAIVDDVVTTGSTITALSEALRKYSVNNITVWCVARTDLKK